MLRLITGKKSMEQKGSIMQSYSSIEAWIDNLSFGEAALVALAMSTIIVSMLAWLFRRKHKRDSTVPKKN